MSYISMNAPADSFAFTFKNLSNAKKSVELFQLGLTNAFTPVQKGLAQDVNGNTRASWVTPLNSYQALALLFEQNPSNPYPSGVSNQDVVWVTQPVITRLGMTDTAGNIFFTDLPISYTGNLDDINAELQNIYQQFVNAGFEGDSDGEIRWTFRPDFPSGTGWKQECFGTTMTKTGEPKTSTKIASIFIEQGGLKIADFTFFNAWYSFNSSVRQIANDVEITAGGGIPYDEIERSQNGAFLDIRGIGVQVLGSSTSSIYTQNSQNLNSLGFLKLNPTGDDYIHYLNPTISPYQTQNVVNDIDMDDKSGLFVLDGNTRFDYDINAWTSVELTFDYVQFPNFILKYGYKVAEAIIDVRQAEQDVINKSNAIRRNYDLDIKEKDVKRIAKFLNYAKQGR